MVLSAGAGKTDNDYQTLIRDIGHIGFVFICGRESGLVGLKRQTTCHGIQGFIKSFELYWELTDFLCIVESS